MSLSFNFAPALRSKLLLTGVALAVAATGWSREILTERAAHDYDARLKAQPALAERLAIPEGTTPAEGDALKFLYAYMATPDALDYDSDYYLENVKLALQAAEEMPWGKDVPDREWRHFVLPIRVNNENLDESRRVFYEELKPRIKDMSIEDAILEVNHWCHEKVSYQPSDPRTSSPLATVGNALGRCGEESTFTVAALRSVGIAARQVYTPRWAHTDDNHAWVEAWANGKWHFLGACEPEAVLDLAWFNTSASRGMLMTTKVTGSYDGPEEKLEFTPITTVINVTENYAPVETSTVIVTDTEGKPLKDARVRFALYNYAEFFPMAVKLTDAEGQAQFISGRGDMVVWATDGNRFNFSSMKAGDTLKLQLDKDKNFTG
ncbi:MAG: transglutaminase domain-containing protein, partial [Duncaniella sp.]|nr:transglutaminase domain-containing protein [Duncaniella sp.]